MIQTKYIQLSKKSWCDVTTRRLRGETDILRKHHLPRLRKGGVEGSILVIWVDPPYDKDYGKRTQQIMTCVDAEVKECDEIQIVHTYDEMMQANKAGKIYIFKGIEGLAAIGEDLSKIDKYYDFGCRHAMLTWNEANALGAGALSGQSYGLTAAGKEAAKLIQAKGMLLDVSHLNDAGFWDIVKLAKKPIVASHSNSRVMCDVPRNLTDDQLRAIRDLDGVVGLNSFNIFVDHDPAKQTVENLARHAEHMIDIMGIDHVGCGFDFFEFIEDEETMGSMAASSTPAVKGMDDASQIPNLFKVFEKMGLSQEERDKIARLNFQAVVKKTIG